MRQIAFYTAYRCQETTGCIVAKQADLSRREIHIGNFAGARII
jgi:hypothetical protein